MTQTETIILTNKLPTEKYWLPSFVKIDPVQMSQIR